MSPVDNLLEQLSLQLDSLNRSERKVAQVILNDPQSATGLSIAALAEKFSQDQGSAVNGGDLGWFTEGLMVEEFNNACFSARKGELVVVKNRDEIFRKKSNLKNGKIFELR